MVPRCSRCPMQISLNGVLRVCVVWRPLAKHPRDQFVSPQIVHSLTGESPCQLIKASTPALGSPGPLFQFLKGAYGHHTYNVHNNISSMLIKSCMPREWDQWHKRPLHAWPGLCKDINQEPEMMENKLHVWP